MIEASCNLASCTENCMYKNVPKVKCNNTCMQPYLWPRVAPTLTARLMRVCSRKLVLRSPSQPLSPSIVTALYTNGEVLARTNTCCQNHLWTLYIFRNVLMIKHTSLPHWKTNTLFTMCKYPTQNTRLNKVYLTITICLTNKIAYVKRRVCFLILMTIGMFVNEVTVDFSCC
jgi:hypothetical protein